MVPEAPVPVAPEVIESHAALEDALQEQLLPLVEIMTEPLPPPAATEAEVGEKPVTPHAVPAWMTANVTGVVTFGPVTVTVAERLLVLAFAVAENVNEPLPPLPEAPARVNQAWLLEADHEHADPPVVTVTETGEAVPPAVTEVELGVAERLVQFAGR